MSAPMQKKAKISGGNLAATEPEGFLLYEGGRVAEDRRSELTRVRIGAHVSRIEDGAFQGCINLIDVQLNEGLQTVGVGAFSGCTALRIVNMPSTVTKLGDKAFGDCINLAELQLNEGLQFFGDGTFAGCAALQSVTIPSTVTKLGLLAFFLCKNLADVHFNEGLLHIGEHAFRKCTALHITLPSTVAKVGIGAFGSCSNLTEVQFNEGLQNIGGEAFRDCTALQSVTIPSTVQVVAGRAFYDCRNLSEVIFLGGETLLNQEFFARGIFSEELGLLNEGALYEFVFGEDGDFAFCRCPLTRVKISISWALSEQMVRLPPNCRVPVEERIRNLPRFELLQDGNVLACFPVVSRSPGVEADDDSDTDIEDEVDIQDTNNETARSLYQVLQLIAFHELKESSIVIELAMWKSRINEDRARVDCRVAIPGPAKSLIMEYGGFTGFLRPAIEGA